MQSVILQLAQNVDKDRVCALNLLGFGRGSWSPMCFGVNGEEEYVCKQDAAHLIATLDAGSSFLDNLIYIEHHHMLRGERLHYYLPVLSEALNDKITNYLESEVIPAINFTTYSCKETFRIYSDSFLIERYGENIAHAGEIWKIPFYVQGCSKELTDL